MTMRRSFEPKPKSGRRWRRKPGYPNSKEKRMAQDPSYFMYFPGNYRWSSAFINMIGSSVYGGADFGELHKIGRLLKDKDPEDDDAWFDACAKVADGVRGYAEKFEGAVHRYSAAHAYLRACNYYQM